MDLLRASSTALFFMSVGCVPEVDVDESIVSEPRVLAIQAIPAEAQPNTEVTYRALLVDQNGVRSEGELSWFYCSVPKPLAELGPISPECLGGTTERLHRIGRGLEVKGTLPADACSLFGPNPPPPIDDQPPGRPPDPDQTGGFKLPVMLGMDVGAGQDILLFEQRMACGLSAVTPRVSIEFNQRYHKNENPAAHSLEVTRSTGANTLLGEADLLEVSANESVDLSLGWAACPQSDSCGDGVCGPDEIALDCAEDCATALGCQGQERYLWFDPQTRELEVRRESLRVAWYGTAGTFENERTGVDEDDTKSRTSNRWTAPESRRELSLWMVLRDARGGVGFRGLKVRVR
jgi:hypothetical protein